MQDEVSILLALLIEIEHGTVAMTSTIDKKCYELLHVHLQPLDAAS